MNGLCTRFSLFSRTFLFVFLIVPIYMKKENENAHFTFWIIFQDLPGLRTSAPLSSKNIARLRFKKNIAIIVDLLSKIVTTYFFVQLCLCFASIVLANDEFIFDKQNCILLENTSSKLNKRLILVEFLKWPAQKCATLNIHRYLKKQQQHEYILFEIGLDMVE